METNLYEHLTFSNEFAVFMLCLVSTSYSNFLYCGFDKYGKNERHLKAMNTLTKLKTATVSSFSEPDHYENMPIQIYWKFSHQTNANFQIKLSDIFHISAQNID